MHINSRSLDIGCKENYLGSKVSSRHHTNNKNNND